MKGLAPTLLVTLLHLSIWCASGQSTGRIVAHPEEYMEESCETVYVGGYHGGTTTSGRLSGGVYPTGEQQTGAQGHYVAWDGSQADDNVTQLDAMIASYCTADTYTVEAELNNYNNHDDDGDPDEVESTALQSLLDACDASYHEGEGLDDCLSFSLPWTCTVSNPSALMAVLRDIQKTEADDCFTEGGEPDFICRGAPVGPQTCSFAALGAGNSATGMSLNVQGDRCRGCSLNHDLCPNWYDVHSCAHTWDGVSTNLPAVGDTFTFTVTLNAAESSFRPSYLISIVLLIGAVVLGAD